MSRFTDADEHGYPIDPNQAYPDPGGAPPSVPYTGPPAYSQPPVYPPSTGAAIFFGAGVPGPSATYRPVDPYGYPGAYPPAPAGSPYPAPGDRPGPVVTAAVLAYVVSGLLVLSGFLIFVGGSATAGLDDGSGGDAAKLIVAGLANVVCGAILIAGGTLLTTQRSGGRAALAIGTSTCVAIAMVWLAVEGPVALVWAAIFCLPVLVATAIAYAAGVSEWLAASNGPGPAGGPATGALGSRTSDIGAYPPRGY